MKSNGKLVELIEKVKPEIRTLIEKCNTVGLCFHYQQIYLIFPPGSEIKSFVFSQVKMWVQLLIPRIEDGNNFGVSIQVKQ